MNAPLILYHYWSSTCSRKARFALIEKGCEWQSRHVDLFRFEHWQDYYLRLNPGGTVPTLVHGETVVTDSNVMLEYIEDVFPAPPLLPETAPARARVRQWLKDADKLGQENAIKAGFNLRYLPRIEKRYSRQELLEIGARNPDPDFRRSWLGKIRSGVPKAVEEQAYAGLQRLAVRMEEQLASTPWLAGEEFSYADIALSPYIERIKALARPEIVARDVRPRIADWWQRVTAREGFKLAFAFSNPDPDDPVKR